MAGTFLYKNTKPFPLNDPSTPKVLSMDLTTHLPSRVDTAWSLAITG